MYALREVLICLLLSWLVVWFFFSSFDFTWKPSYIYAPFWSCKTPTRFSNKCTFSLMLRCCSLLYPSRNWLKLLDMWKIHEILIGSIPVNNGIMRNWEFQTSITQWMNGPKNIKIYCFFSTLINNFEYCYHSLRILYVFQWYCHSWLYNF